MEIFKGRKKGEQIQPVVTDYLDPLGWLVVEAQKLIGELHQIPESSHKAKIDEMDAGIVQLQTQLKSYTALKKAVAEERNVDELNRLKTAEKFCELDIAQLRQARSKLHAEERKEFFEAAKAIYVQMDVLLGNYKAKAEWVTKTLISQEQLMYMLYCQARDASMPIKAQIKESSSHAETMKKEYDQTLKALINGEDSLEEAVQPKALTGESFTGHPGLALEAVFDGLLENLSNK